MKKHILSAKGNRLSKIPRDEWEQRVEKAPLEISKMLNFMSDDHHLVRKYVVGELPGFGKPVPPVLISEELNISLSKTIEILDDLERNLFFLVRNEKGEVSWAFPVTIDETPHRLTFSTGEKINAA